MNKTIALLTAMLGGIFFFSPVVLAEEPAPALVSEPLFASVNSSIITQKDFQAAYHTYLREKYYHRQVPEGLLNEAKKETANRLIDKILLLDEAKRRGVAADEAKVEKAIAGYEAQYASSPVWQQRREGLLPGLRQQLAEQSLIEQMEKIGREFPEPSDAEVKAYYSNHLELFVEPGKMRLHTILLKVDPSSPKATWDAARGEAQRILERLKEGMAFDDLARMHSNDRSAEDGGNMGYVHKGMIPEHVQAELDKSVEGIPTPPIDVLEGVAIFRLDERVEAKQLGFEEVFGRARDLLKREAATKAWDTFIGGLRSKANIRFYEEAKATGDAKEQAENTAVVK